jgi:hypothetical protein
VFVVLAGFVLLVYVVVVGSLALLQRKLQVGCWFLGSGWCSVVKPEVAEVQQAKQRKLLIYWFT